MLFRSLSGGGSGLNYSPYLPAGQVLVSNNFQLIAGSMSVKNPEISVGPLKTGAGILDAAIIRSSKGAEVRVTQNATLAAGKHTIKPIAKSGANDTVYVFGHKAAIQFFKAPLTGKSTVWGFTPDVTSAAIYVGPFM